MSNPPAQPIMGSPSEFSTMDTRVDDSDRIRRSRLRNPWAYALPTLVTAAVGFAMLYLMVQSFLTKQLDVKGCEMAYMRPMYSKFENFDTEHTRLASKYSLYLYREWGIDEEFTVKGIPVLFIPGNAGSYKQVRSLASESAYHYHNTVQNEENAWEKKRPLDFFSVDFNEDFTAFHGQTLLDQAEYLNDAITFILSLYHTPGSAQRDSHLPDPTSVITVGHSMGGVVARTMFTMPNYQANSINTIVTLAAPHARPPVSFDGDIVRTYKGVNDYWRSAFAQKWAAGNPLGQVTLVSIAGGGLDTIVSSDYASIASLIPESHGFTVFTSSIPNVWTGMDHLAITWCDQARKAVVKALYDVVDVSSATQTIPPTQRMRGFKRWFLTGLEDVVERSVPEQEAQTTLTIEPHWAVLAEDERLVLSSLGSSDRKPNVQILPIPRSPATHSNRFSLLTNERLDSVDGGSNLEVLLCRDIPLQPGQNSPYVSMSIDSLREDLGSIKFACKNAVADVITLPESAAHSDQPFRPDQRPFYYLEYTVDELVEHHNIVIVDKSSVHHTGWVLAEFGSSAKSTTKLNMSLPNLLFKGASVDLPAHRPLTTHIHIPALHSSLLAYDLHLSRQSCDKGELFTPLVRQYITDVYESKFFVNVEDAKINLHGVSPYLPPALTSQQSTNGLSLQIWSDPTCNSQMAVTLRVDILGSLGKLWMRYRIVFAAFPLLIVALVLRQQFRTYDQTGVFMSFAQGLNESLRSTIPLALTSLTLMSVILARTRQQSTKPEPAPGISANLTSSFDDASHELLLGNDDPFFWFLVPLFGVMCIGVCLAVNYVALLLEYIFAFLFSLVSSSMQRSDNGQRTPSTFAVNSNRRRILTSMVLLSLVSTVIPYHFAYVVLCIVQLATSVRGFRLAKESRTDSNYNFYNYAHSIFILMLWILPINIPVLVVWIRNLTVQWLTPFSSHHNILSIMPFTLLVETICTGRMIPRVQFKVSLVTNILLFSIGAYAAVYGVSYAYVLHHLANVLCAWLVSIHLDFSSLSSTRVDGMNEGIDQDDEMKKRP